MTESLKITALFRNGSKTHKICSYTRKGLSINFLTMSKAGNTYYLVLRNRKQVYVSHSKTACQKIYANTIFEDVLQSDLPFEDRLELIGR